MDDNLPKQLLVDTLTLIDKLDTYTTSKFIKTGLPTNTPSCFREELLSFALAVACEVVNPNDGQFSEEDFLKAQALIEKPVQCTNA